MSFPELETAIGNISTDVHRLVLTRHVQSEVHGNGVFGRINTNLAVWITRGVGSMWCAYLFVLITLVSLPQAWTAFVNGDRVTGVSWLAQTFFQLVLLPIIIVGQNVISAAQDRRAEADHETLVTLQKINNTQLEILTRLDSMEHRGGPTP